MHLQLKMTADEVMSCCYIFDPKVPHLQSPAMNLILKKNSSFMFVCLFFMNAFIKDWMSVPIDIYNWKWQPMESCIANIFDPYCHICSYRHFWRSILKIRLWLLLSIHRLIQQLELRTQVHVRNSAKPTEIVFICYDFSCYKDSSNRFDGIHFCDDNARIGSHRKPCVDMSDDTYFYLKPN